MGQGGVVRGKCPTGLYGWDGSRVGNNMKKEVSDEWFPVGTGDCGCAGIYHGEDGGVTN